METERSAAFLKKKKRVYKRIFMPYNLAFLHAKTKESPNKKPCCNDKSISYKEMMTVSSPGCHAVASRICCLISRTV